MSVDYYIRLEQARGPRPSRQILAALARALVLTADERDYLFRLAGENPLPAAGPPREISPGLRNLLDSLPDTPAYVVDAKYDILAWNELATYFIGDLSDHPDSDRNVIRWTFARPASSRGCGRSTRSRPAARSSSASTTRWPARSNSSARSCTSVRPASGSSFTAPHLARGRRRPSGGWPEGVPVRTAA
jgi:MmyB-like transcription regulator ligand binding domain/Helix-turn-helix domain